MENNERQFNEFLQLLLETMKFVSQEIESGIERFELIKATKANLGKVDGIVARFSDGSNTSPTIYPNLLFEKYKNGTNIEAIAAKAVETLMEGHNNMPTFDVTAINPENAKEHLFMVLLNKELNADMAEKCPHVELNDLIAFPRWRVSKTNDGVASILVTHDIQSQLLHMTDEEVCALAKAATIEKGFTIKGMNETMMEMVGKDFSSEFLEEMYPPEEMMFVVTNFEKINGAVALLDRGTLEAVREKIGEESFFVIPSSVHEILVVPESKVTDPADLKRMCEEVNATEVAPVEKLSDNIYRYDGTKLQICNNVEQLQIQTATAGMERTETVHVGRRM